MSRYGLKPDRWSSHSVLARLLTRLPAGSRVLDVGTATGTLGRLLAGRGLLLSGLEPEARGAEAAGPYYSRLLNCRLEEAPDDFLTGYQAVVCADILEHLAEPEVALRRLAALSAPDCLFLVSVPNVANLWVRLNLLLGRFPYAERGILDRTHLRFFTRETFLALLAAANLQPVRLLATPVPLGLVWPGLARAAWGQAALTLLAGLTRLVPTVFGYQFIALCEQPRARSS